MPELRAILTYHSIDDSGSFVSVSAETFRSQMRSLFERGIQTTFPADLLSNQGLDPKHPAAALTFDDGFDNFYTEAFPILSEFNMRATVFLVPGRCGKAGDWARQPEDHRSRELMSWSRIAELHAAGVELGAHTMTHPMLTSLPPDQAQAEILDSKREIEDRLGSPVRSFAYPYGDESASLRQIVRRNFDVGCSTRMGYLKPGALPESVERLDVYYLRNLFWFGRLFRGFTNAYLGMRGLLRSVKQKARN